MTEQQNPTGGLAIVATAEAEVIKAADIQRAAATDQHDDDQDQEDEQR